MTHSYSLSRRLEKDAMLAIALAAALLVMPHGPFATTLALAAPLVFAWGVITLHFPHRVDVDSNGVSFAAYGRAHRFGWSRVERLHVRRFLMKDRVLVRVEPAPAWGGRYWITDKISGFDELVRELEARATSRAAATRA
jgi:hypothetical protein